MHARVSRGARRSAMRAIAVILAWAVSACGGGASKKLLGASTTTSSANGGIPAASGNLGFPVVATKNTTRVPGSDPIADAAGVARAVFPSVVPGTHPTAVTLAPTGDWQAAIAASVLMAPPIHAPVLLSGATTLPAATADALTALAPTGSGAAGGAQVIRIGAVPAVKSRRSAAIHGTDPYALAAGIDRFVSALAGKPSNDVVIASGTNPPYAMPAAGVGAGGAGGGGGASEPPLLVVGGARGRPPAPPPPGAAVALQAPHLRARAAQ